MKTIIIVCLLFASIALQAQIQNNGNLQMHSGAQVGLQGNFANNGTFVDSGQVVVLFGTANQDISGSSSIVFNRLRVDKSNSAILQRNVSVNKLLELNNGIFDLNSKVLTILNSAGSAVTRSNGYVLSEKTDNSSIFAWNINSTTGLHVFPMGTVLGVYIPFSLNLTAGNIGGFSLATYPTAVNNTPFPTTPIAVTHLLAPDNSGNSANVVDRFWNTSSSGPNGVATLTFTATPAEVGVLSGLIAQNWNVGSSGWNDSIAGQSSTAISATVSGVTDFSVWVLVAKSNPLPIELLSFDAFAGDNLVNLNWSTATETGTNYFTIEKTSDFEHFFEVAQVDAAGNSNQTNYYRELDYSPFSAWSWYRLKVNDLNGDVYYSDYASVYFDAGSEMVACVYPVPTNRENINLMLQNCENGLLTIELFDCLGQLEYQDQQQVDTETYSISLPSDIGLTQGINTLRVSLGNNVINKRIVIQ